MEAWDVRVGPVGVPVRALIRLGHGLVLVGTLAALLVLDRPPPRTDGAGVWLPLAACLVLVIGAGLAAAYSTVTLDPLPRQRGSRFGGPPSSVPGTPLTRRQHRLVRLLGAPVGVAGAFVVVAPLGPARLALFVAALSAALLLATASAAVDRDAPRPGPRPTPSPRKVAVVRAGGQLDLLLFGLLTGTALVLLVATVSTLSSVDAAPAVIAVQVAAALAVALLSVPHAQAGRLVRRAATGRPTPRLLTEAATLQRAAAVAAVPTVLLAALAHADSADATLPGEVGVLALLRCLVLLLGLYVAAFSTDRTAFVAAGGAGDVFRTRVGA